MTAPRPDAAVESAARVRLATLPTPLHRAHRLERALGTGPLYLKRDDLTGFAVAGNKARPLEFLLGAALAQDCDVLVTAGSPSSNFCAAAAVAARAARAARAAGVAPRTVLVPTGSGGTQAGIVAGQVGFGLPWRVVGASVSRPARWRTGSCCWPRSVRP